MLLCKLAMCKRNHYTSVRWPPLSKFSVRCSYFVKLSLNPLAVSDSSFWHSSQKLFQRYLKRSSWQSVNQSIIQSCTLRDGKFVSAFVGKHQCFKSYADSAKKPVEGMQQWGHLGQLASTWVAFVNKNGWIHWLDVGKEKLAWPSHFSSGGWEPQSCVQSQMVWYENSCSGWSQDHDMGKHLEGCLTAQFCDISQARPEFCQTCFSVWRLDCLRDAFMHLKSFFTIQYIQIFQAEQA